MYLPQVLSTTGLILRSGASHYCDHVEIFALLVGALAHDLGHPGLTNDHFIKIRHQIAMVYNDQNPLENLHSCLLTRVLCQPGANVAETLTTEEFVKFRKCCIQAILNTSMSVHADLVGQLQDLLPLGGAGAHLPEVAGPEALARKSLMQKCIVRAADLANAVQPWGIYLQWAERRRTSREFFCCFSAHQIGGGRVVGIIFAVCCPTGSVCDLCG